MGLKGVYSFGDEVGLLKVKVQGAVGIVKCLYPTS